MLDCGGGFAGDNLAAHVAFFGDHVFELLKGDGLGGLAYHAIETDVSLFPAPLAGKDGSDVDGGLFVHLVSPVGGELVTECYSLGPIAYWQDSEKIFTSIIEPIDN